MQQLFNTSIELNSQPVFYKVYKLERERYYVEVILNPHGVRQATDFVIYSVQDTWITYNPNFIHLTQIIGKEIEKYFTSKSLQHK
ncbi:MAG TPA: hypothetical protein VM012_11850 [Flavitalea sp.]|nr:hypothetical protein [Flavitalea sp.]